MSQQEKIERVRFLSIEKIYAENRTRQNWRKHRQTAALCNNSIEKVTFRPQFDCAQLLFPFPFSLFSFLSSTPLSSPLLCSSLLFSSLLSFALLFSSLLFSTHSLRFLDLRDAEVSLRNILWKSSLKLVQTLGQVEQLVEKEVERQVKQLRQQDCVFVCMYLHAWYKYHITGKGQHL